jgi:hypothetical protein
MTNTKIRTAIKNLIADGLISEESEYTFKGVYIKWLDGDISATTDTGSDGWKWLKSTILGGVL